MSLADAMQEVAGDFEATELRNLLEQFVAPPDPSWGVRSGGGASTPMSAADVMANAGGMTMGDLGVGSLTGVELADGSIETEHLQADVVVANVVNVGGTVTIDENGIVIEGGALVFIDTYGATVLTGLGFGGGWLDFLNHRTYNGGFRASPPTPGSDITTGDLSANQLPNWVFTQVSGTKVTTRWLADTGVGSGGMVKISMANGGAPADEAYLEAIIPIMSGRSQDFGYSAVASFYAPTADMGTIGFVILTVETQYLAYDGVTPTGTVNSENTVPNGINVRTNHVGTVTVPGTVPGAGAPPDAGFLRVRIDLDRNGAGNTLTGAIYLTGLRIVQHDYLFSIVDVEDPTRVGFTITKGNLGVAGETWFNVGGDFFFLHDEDSGDIALAAAGALNVGAASDDATFYSVGHNIVLDADQTFIKLHHGALVIEDWFTAASFTTRRDDYDPGGHNQTVWLLSNTSGGGIQITGILAPTDGGSKINTVHLLVNTSTAGNNITLAHGSAFSAADNRINCPTYANYVITPGASVWVIYDVANTRWQVIGA